MSWLMDGISAAFDALFGWLKLIFDSLKNVLFDLPILIFEKLLNMAAWLIGQITSMLELCCFPINGAVSSFQSLFNQLQAIPELGQAFCFFLSHIGLDTALACIGAGLTFRLLRKAVTLGHW